MTKNVTEWRIRKGFVWHEDCEPLDEVRPYLAGMGDDEPSWLCTFPSTDYLRRQARDYQEWDIYDEGAQNRCVGCGVFAPQEIVDAALLCGTHAQAFFTSWEDFLKAMRGQDWGQDLDG